MTNRGSEKSFNLEFKPFDTGLIRGEIALIPWDTELFGFTVAEIKNITFKDHATHENLPSAHFASFLQEKEIQLCCARIESNQVVTSFELQNQQFRFIEISYAMHHQNLQQYDIRLPAVSLRTAQTSDADALKAIAGKSFTHERFHTDPRLSKRDSHRRYQQWIENSLLSSNAEVLVSENDQGITGFFASSFPAADVVDLKLGALEPSLLGSGMGALLWHSVVKHYKERGFKKGITRVSSNNIPILRIWQHMQFSITSSEQILHWWNT